jgi:hypothetical protein
VEDLTALKPKQPFLSRKRSGGDLTAPKPKQPGSSRGQSAAGLPNKSARLDFNTLANFKGPNRALGGKLKVLSSLPAPSLQLDLQENFDKRDKKRTDNLPA